MLCQATSKRTRKPCGHHATPGRDVCRIHGGATPIGPGSPHYRHGRYSKFLPSCLAAAYEDACHDPKLRELRDQIAAVDARIVDLLQRVDTGEAGSLWQGARAAMARLKREQSRNNVDGMMLALTQAEQFITRGADDSAAWQEIGELIDLRRRLCDSETRRLHLAHDTLTADRAMLMMAELVRIIQRHVTDRAVLAAIAADIRARSSCASGTGPIRAGERDAAMRRKNSRQIETFVTSFGPGNFLIKYFIKSKMGV